MGETTEEFLLQSMPLTRSWARSLCHHIDDSGISCAPFHEIWPMLRLLGLNTTPAEHRKFFLEAMTPAIRAGARRVLITGTADYAMLEVVREAFAAGGASPDITVIDVCETPLRVCHWYADKVKMVIRTRRNDVLTYSDEAAYDLVCTHSLLGLFDKTSRQQLASRWHALLVPGGTVLSVNRVRPGSRDRVSFTQEQADVFVQQVCQLLAKSELASRFDLRDVADLANRYIRHRVIYPIRDEQEISKLLSSSGFHLEFLRTELLAAQPGTPSGPTLRGDAKYAQFVASRPS